MKTQLDRRVAAFSLLELLIVVAIIATLIGIMVPPMFHFIQYVRHMGGN